MPFMSLHVLLHLQQGGESRTPTLSTVDRTNSLVQIAGYSHFTGAGTNATHMDPGAHCALWDDTGARNFQEVSAQPFPS